jgi:hypothetical protein
MDVSRAEFRRLAPRAAGDCLVIVAVLAIGIVRHRGLEGLLDVTGVAETVTPFLVSWLVVAPLLGAYRGTAIEDRWGSVLRGVLAWVGAAILGSGIRATPFFAGGATPAFVAVIAGTGALGIAVWRLLRHEIVQ